MQADYFLRWNLRVLLDEQCAGDIVMETAFDHFFEEHYAHWKLISVWCGLTWLDIFATEDPGEKFHSLVGVVLTVTVFTSGDTTTSTLHDYAAVMEIEQNDGLYGIFSGHFSLYALNVAHLSLKLVIPLFVTYFMLGLQVDSSAMGFYLLCNYFAMYCSVAYAMMCYWGVRNLELANKLVILLIVISQTTAGVLVADEMIFIGTRWARWINFLRWNLRVLLDEQCAGDIVMETAFDHFFEEHYAHWKLIVANACMIMFFLLAGLGISYLTKPTYVKNNAVNSVEVPTSSTASSSSSVSVLVSDSSTSDLALGKKEDGVQK